MKARKSQAFLIAQSGMMAALVFVATYFFKLPVSVTQGYIHLGDGFVLLGAALLGSPAIAAAAIGSMLADLLGGYTLYILPTFFIKGAVAWIAVRTFACKRPTWMIALCLVLAEAVMVLGYFLFAGLLMGEGWAAAASIPGNLAQGAVGLGVALTLEKALGRVNWRKMMSE